jgi:hypothetical protein
MKRLWLPLTIVLLLPSGCARKAEPPPATVDRPIAKPQAKTAKSQAEIAKPPTEIAKPRTEIAKPPTEQPAHRLVDEFNLPLVFHIETPEVPPEIRNPSPAFEPKPEPPPGIFNPFRIFQQKPKSP